jgi:hypothetical protein
MNTNINNNFIFSLLVSGIFYISSHLFRCVRIALLFDKKHIKFRQIIYTQVISNLINIIIPFRLGEIFRIILFNSLNNNIYKTTSLIFIERTFDLTWMFLCSIILFKFFDFPFQHKQLLITVSFIFLTLFYILFSILPKFIQIISIHTTKTYTSKKTVYMLKVLSKIYLTLSQISNNYKKNIVFLFFLTTLIWSCEVGVFFVLYYDIIKAPILASISFSTFLSFLYTNSSNPYNGTSISFSEALSFYKIKPIENFLNYTNIVYFWGVITALLVSLILIFKKLRNYEK